MQLDSDKMFFAIGQYPADDLGAQLGCERDEGGHIVVDEHGHTSVRNVFAAGDIMPGPQLAIAAPRRTERSPRWRSTSRWCPRSESSTAAARSATTAR